MTILDEILANKRQELPFLKEKFPLESLQKKANYSRTCLSLKSSLQASDSGIISEFKRKSPSKGFIKEHADVLDIVPGYAANGASGISILMDTRYFGGGFHDMECARPKVNVPLLFKEFVVDEYQLHLAKAFGADVVLLIASALTEDECSHLASVAKSLGLETLLELHEPDEVKYIQPNVDMVGINNRNLKTFEVNLDASIRLCHSIPDSYLKISESGISSPDTVKRLRKEGFRGFLMGENFMKEENPPLALAKFIDKVLDK
ncbi:MAG TPA: indole-3-glycerol phosphate synthase TrpC [Paludibacteraceae bacterium]|nr:indole-3-glycerol phosphate synthase TrpC [Paludibacteraceae bacterium]HOU68276.1 indole-3-glycerol phosphate synthase TrpC [Paludibacteraceae bacterium]HPH62781.1 indole-3-glycerol phosphate synthase TrpC [Paludibacteraceae bacterium]HQF50228.1 indole-3-glycerol phosphate synthase TrpC [Paludibacteraceae bacterium]HQJ89042.1 indole-3-glycerol phosphate synthase TrpC [Paludibacteraceae bacterium]